MSGYVTLLGAEEVSRAASRIQDAASRMEQAAMTISEAADRATRAMNQFEEQVQRLAVITGAQE